MTIYTVKDLKELIADLPDEALVFTNFGAFDTGIHASEYVEYPNIKVLYLTHTMSNCIEVNYDHNWNK